MARGESTRALKASARWEFDLLEQLAARGCVSFLVYDRLMWPAVVEGGFIDPDTPRAVC